MNSSILVDAIIGRGVTSMEVSSKLEKEGVMTFTGDQHNPEWKFKKSLLKTYSKDTLETIYTEVCGGVL